MGASSSSVAFLAVMLTWWAAGGCSSSSTGATGSSATGSGGSSATGTGGSSATGSGGSSAAGSGGSSATGSGGSGAGGSATGSGGSGTGGGDLGPGCVVLFATSFEAPTYAEGVLDGQDMWSGADKFAIATSKPHSGLQGVHFDATSDYYAVSRPIVADASMRVFTISVWHHLGQLSDWSGLRVNALVEDDMISQIVGNFEGRYAMEDALTCAMPPPPNCNQDGELVVDASSWNHITMTIDFDALTVTGYVNGAPFLTAPLGDPLLTTVGSVMLQGYGAWPNDFDDLSVTACPAP